VNGPMAPDMKPPRVRDDPGTFSHTVVVLVVVVAATVLDAIGRLDSTTLSTVYGAALGYASGLTVATKRGTSE
jgi:hypothetical protein